MANTADTWPPAPFDLAMSRFAEHDAWATGDTGTLQLIYSGRGGVATHVHAGQAYKGGVIGTLSKFFWGQKVVEGEQRTMMHIPIAADLAQLSADLLFSEAPKIRYAKPAGSADSEKPVDGKKWKHPGQDRLDLIMGSDEAHAELLKSGEYAAALGGTYLAVVWDETIAKHVWFRAYAADCAIPEFRYGRLTAVTLWTEYRMPDGRDVYRLLERHDVGVISYTLHKGGEKNLGEVVPLSSLAETAHYNRLRSEAEITTALDNPELWSETVTIATGVDALAVVYYPNMLPQRDWRKLGALAHLGRSDFAGIEDLFDKIDQVWSSLLRDIKNGAGRLTVPSSYLEVGDVGEGATFDRDREIYSGINALGAASDTLASQITNSQFDIRVEEHLAAIDAIKREIASNTGYSPTHLGLKNEGGQQTATEVVADFTDSERTRDKKALYAKPALARLAQVALAIDGVLFPQQGGKWYDELPDVEFAPVSQEDPEKRARSIQMLDMARAASTKRRVTLANPDMDTDEIDEEVKLILKELGTPAPDPTTFDGVDPVVPADGALE